MLTPIQVEYNLQSAEYYFATLMDQLVDETMQLEPVDCDFTEQVNQLFYTIEAVRFLVDRGIFTDNPTCLAVYNCMMIQIGINTSLPDLAADTTLIIPGIVLPIPFQGPQGPAGPQGVQGVQGPVGQQGPQGSQGPIGNQGVQGPQGSIGSQGLQGPIGPQGPQGLQGTQGNQGFQGVQGPTGTQGFQGDQGPQGSQGFQGNQGFQGPTGPQGFQGFQGPNGPQGFQGDQGPIGPQGNQGFQGPIGPQGFQGTQGNQGFQGPVGPQGTIISGTTNYITKFTSSTTIGNSILFEDTANGRIGFNTTSPAATLDVAYNGTRASMYITNLATSGTDNISEFRLVGWDGATQSIIGQCVGTDSAVTTTDANAIILRASRATGILRFDTGGNNERMRITSAGNVGIGTSTPTATNLAISKNITGSSSVSYGINVDATIQSDVTSSAFGYNSRLSTAAASFTVVNLVHYNVTTGTLGSTSAITTQTGFNCGTLGNATNVYAFRGQISAATGRWNLFMDGGATSFIGGTTLMGGSATDNGTTAKLQVTGGISYQNIFNRQSASYTLVLTDQSKIVEMNVGSANNLTVPLNSSVSFPIGTEIQVLQYGAGQTTIVATSGVTLRSKSGQLKIGDQYTGVTLVKVGTDEWYVIGNLSA